MLISLTDGSLATSSSPNQSQLSLPGLVAFASNENQSNNINNNNNGLNAMTAGGATTATSGSNKSRSHSTTSLYNQHPNGKRLMRERKTVCSLHPLSTTSNNELTLLDAFNCPAHAAGDSDSQQQHLRDRENDSENEALSCSLPGSAVDSRRGSGISTRCVQSQS